MSEIGALLRKLEVFLCFLCFRVVWLAEWLGGSVAVAVAVKKKQKKNKVAAVSIIKKYFFLNHNTKLYNFFTSTHFSPPQFFFLLNY
jgi:hypothetical protein